MSLKKSDRAAPGRPAEAPPPFLGEGPPPVPGRIDWPAALAEAVWHGPSRLALAFIFFYQKCISPLLPPCCRFRPTCSCYAAEAVKTHGFWRGSYLAARRLLKCHPFHPGGYDPVPPKSGGIAAVKSGAK